MRLRGQEPVWLCPAGSGAALAAVAGVRSGRWHRAPPQDSGSVCPFSDEPRRDVRSAPVVGRRTGIARAAVDGVSLLQGECTAAVPASRAGQNFCGSDDRCRNHDETAWCADSTLSPCPLLRPTIGGDCKLAGNLFAQFGNAGAAEQPAAIAAGVHFGSSAICLGVPSGRFARSGVAAWRLSETCFASQCDEAGALSVLVKDAEGDGFKEHPCPEGEFLVLPVEDGFEEGVRALCMLCFAQITPTSACCGRDRWQGIRAAWT